jgi:hypothetical protein
MYSKIQSSVLIGFLALTGFGFLTSCDNEKVSPLEDLSTTNALARKTQDSIPGWPPIDSLHTDTLIYTPGDSNGIDTLRGHHPHTDSLHHMPPWYSPKDSSRIDSVRQDSIRKGKHPRRN